MIRNTMSIMQSVDRLREIRNAKSELSAEENMMCMPLIEDLTLIDDIYKVFLGYIKDNNLELNSNERRKFIVVVLYLYSLGTLAGGKMKNGIRDRLAEVTGCTCTLISHNCENLIFQYTHYKEFKEGVDELMRRVVETLPVNITPVSSGCHAKGYPILMADGGTKNVEDIQVGDRVMGDDGTPRKVLELHGGKGRLMRIKPSKGDAFYVNEGHVLSLFSRSRREVTEITAMSYYRQIPKVKRDLMLRMGEELIRFEVFRTRKIDFYYGFTTDGNHLYLDAQGFTHHNYI